jgi:hypothetical protein
MVGIWLLLALLGQPAAENFDVELDHLPAYARVPSRQVEDATAMEAVDWDLPAPKIRSAGQFWEAKNRAVPVIWFEGRLYFLTPQGDYVDSLAPPVPTPTPRPFGDVEFANGTARPIQFYVRLGFDSRTMRSVNVPAYSSQRAVLPLGAWQYVVVGGEPSKEYASRGEFSVEPYGVTHVLYGFPGRSIERARNWIEQEDDIRPGGRSASRPGTETHQASEKKISRILADIPRYPNALRLELPMAIPNYAYFKTLDSEENILSFYDRTLKESGWQPLEQRDRMLSFIKTDRKVLIEILPSQEGVVSHQILVKVYPLE